MTTPLVLLNPVSITLNGGQHTFLPGAIITDAVALALITGVGGQLVPQTLLSLSAAALARKFQAKGADATAQAIIMLTTLVSQGLSPLTLTDTLTGPGAAGSQTLVAVPVGHSAVLVLSALATVLKAGVGGTETAGDAYSFGARVTLKNVSGTVAVVKNRQNDFPLDADASMLDATITPGGSGGNAVLGYANGALIGAGASVSWTIDAQVRIF